MTIDFCGTIFVAFLNNKTGKAFESFFFLAQIRLILVQFSKDFCGFSNSKIGKHLGKKKSTINSTNFTTNFQWFLRLFQQ